MKLGKINQLSVGRRCDYGLYLEDENGFEVLLPNRYVTSDMHEGSMVESFVYNDSEDRPVASTEHPLVTVGEFAYLEVKAVNRIGAFLDWGLSKDLLVPFNQQQSRMKEGGRYLVYVYLDDASKRIVASAKINKFLGNVYPDLKRNDEVTALVYSRNDVGYLCIVNNLHRGILYENEVFTDLHEGDLVKARVKSVRPDGKIDLTLYNGAKDRTAEIADRIREFMKENGGELPYGDKSSPEVIRLKFQCSKKDFKKALGLMLKQGEITKGEGFHTV